MSDFQCSECQVYPLILLQSVCQSYLLEPSVSDLLCFEYENHWRYARSLSLSPVPSRNECFPHRIPNVGCRHWISRNSAAGECHPDFIGMAARPLGPTLEPGCDTTYLPARHASVYLSLKMFLSSVHGRHTSCTAMHVCQSMLMM